MEEIKGLEIDVELDDLQVLNQSIEAVVEGPFGRSVKPNVEIKEEVIESLGDYSDYQARNEDLEGNHNHNLPLIIL
jgi:hypothetical protein